jgi:molecular chaperone GrpE
METVCPVCSTVRIEGLDCTVCGWEYLSPDDEHYTEKLNEAIEVFNSAKESSEELPENHEMNEEVSEENSFEEKPEENVAMDADSQYAADEMESEESSVENPPYAEEQGEESQNIKELIDDGVERVVKVFEEKLLYDKAKEKQIDRLHNELQEYKRDLLSKTNRPLINGLIFMFDDMDKSIKKFEASEDEMSQETLLKILIGVREDIEILLEENGVVTFVEDGERFNPKRQQVIKKIPIDDKEKVGEIVEHIRPGFEQGDDLIRKERVGVYVYDDTVEKEEIAEKKNEVSEEEQIQADKIENSQITTKENDNE